MTVTVAVDLLLALIENASRISSMIRNANADGRDTFTPDEWQAVLSADDNARAEFAAAIARAEGG